jgi:hypothetical protein
MNHYTNLGMQTFSKLAIVGKIANVSQIFYAYFHSPKKTQEFAKLANIVKIKHEVNAFFGTSKLGEFLCYSQQIELYLNTKPWF